eukprot:GHUV01023459.1.p1 GENE.GHUV01023459.1~~GHUV01023459.1.p1  ORF type:complete len:549 (+),score=212.06 GHUV01023459.1:91-1737(+)
MFKKPFCINQTHKVSGADRKKIRRSVEKALQLSSDDSSNHLELLLPAKAGDLELAKLPAPSRLVIYLLDSVPILLDVSGKLDFVPTVMGLWCCPQLLPQVTVKHPAVSQFILSGADLMLPGVDVRSLPQLEKGQLVGICVPGNPAPIAVGAALMNSTAAAAQASGQGKGKLVELLQYYGDTLWQTLGKGAVPNAGFLQGYVLPAELATASPQQQQAYLEADGTAAADATDGMLGLSLNRRSEGHVATESNNSQAASTAGQCDGAAVAADTSTTSSSFPDDMDQLLELALLQALHKSVKEDDLPLSGSDLWSQHIIHCRPPGTLLDVKKSTHKKMKNFLQAYTKAGLIKTREDKHSGDVILTGVNRDPQLYSEFKPYKMSSSSAPLAGTSSSTPASAAEGSGDRRGTMTPLVVEEVFKPSREVRPIFEAVGADPEGHYTAAAAGEVAFEYAKLARLDATAPDHKTLMLDAVLCDALYKGLLKKGELYPTHIAKSDLREAFLRRLQPQTRISRGAKALLRKGAPPTVNISGERRQGNKYVTRVVGVEAFL